MGENRLRVNVMFGPDALRELDALAAARYGGNRSRAVDDAVTLAALVLNRKGAYGLSPRAALAAYCRARRGGGDQTENGGA